MKENLFPNVMEFPMLSSSSNSLLISEVPASTKSIRAWYLKDHKISPHPWIVYSLVNETMVALLMRNKKDSAIGEKFVARNTDRFLDMITNMEGLLHTFVTPIVQAVIHGDYFYANGHKIMLFGDSDKKQLGRSVLISALVQQDFEDRNVMLRLAALEEDDCVGVPSLPRMISVLEKNVDEKRREYDAKIKKFLIFSLTIGRSLPKCTQLHEEGVYSMSEAIQFLKALISSNNDAAIEIRHRFLLHKNHYISLEILFNTAVHQIENELCALERLCSRQGYTYTWDPPVIFSRFFDHGGRSRGTEFMSLIHLNALKYSSDTSSLPAMKVFAWNDFNSTTILASVSIALKNNPHVLVMSKGNLFARKLDALGRIELYTPPAGCEETILVLHNNSDGFGQNIQTEGSAGSIDGALGNYSSAAASLMRERADLLDFVVKRES